MLDETNELLKKWLCAADATINIAMMVVMKLLKSIVSIGEALILDWIVLAMRHKRFLQTTAPQVQAWPVAPKGHVLVATAETGSGKTMA